MLIHFLPINQYEFRRPESWYSGLKTLSHNYSIFFIKFLKSKKLILKGDVKNEFSLNLILKIYHIFYGSVLIINDFLKEEMVKYLFKSHLHL